MKRVLVTGASGFIGFHSLAPLLERGYEVHASGVASPGSVPSGVEWHTADLLQPGGATELLRKVRPTHLLHCAWYVVPGKLISSPENFRWVEASMELLRGFAEVGGTRLVTSGSSYEYDWRYGFCSERVTPCTPDTVYGRCKLSLGDLTGSFASSAGISSGWARIFFLYGPREHPDRLVSSIIRSLLKGAPAQTSHGLQIRDYLHVQEVADSMVALLESHAEGPVNIGSGIPITLRQIIETIGRLMGREDLLRIGALPARKNDAPMVVADVSRLTEEVGWKPRLTLEEGLSQTIDWWKNSQQQEGSA